MLRSLNFLIFVIFCYISGSPAFVFMVLYISKLYACRLVYFGVMCPYRTDLQTFGLVARPITWSVGLATE